MFDRVVNINPVKIIDDGVIISPGFGDGRPIPVVIVDASSRPDIVEYIEAHRTQPPGDVTIQWGTPLTSKKTVSLMLKSHRPAKIDFAIVFNAEKHHSLIDGILCTNGFYLQAGNVGDKVSSLIDDGKIVVEVGETGFETTWEKILTKTVKKRFKKDGVGRKKISSATKEYIGSMREFWNRRKNA